LSVNFFCFLNACDADGQCAPASMNDNKQMLHSNVGLAHATVCEMLHMSLFLLHSLNSNGVVPTHCCCNSRSEVQILDRSNLTQRWKRFATASTSTQVTVLPWRYDAELAPQTRYTLWRNTVSIMKGLVLVC